MIEIISTATKPIHATINIPGSKSITNRALLLAALAKGTSHLTGLLMSDDTKALIMALQQLGIAIQLNEKNCSCTIIGCHGQFPKKEASLWCHSAGTVARFLLAACAHSDGKYYFDATPQLRHRPIDPLINALKKQGVKFYPDTTRSLPFAIESAGRLIGGKIEIDSSETSQFFSALLIAAPFAKKPIEIFSRSFVSRPYIEMTSAMMAEFGVIAQRLDDMRYSIPTPQYYKARNYVIEPDLSTASYFFAAAAVTGGQITVPSFDRRHTKQGDIAFLSLLEQMGCEIIEETTGVTIKSTRSLQGIHCDMCDCSDTFMTLAAIAPFATTPTTIMNIAHTQLQESNRLQVMFQELKKIGIKVEKGLDWLRIYPSVPRAGTIESHDDHRIAMSFSIIGLRINGIKIKHAACVSKTCPNFFTLWKKLIE